MILSKIIPNLYMSLLRLGSAICWLTYFGKPCKYWRMCLEQLSFSRTVNECSRWLDAGIVFKTTGISKRRKFLLTADIWDKRTEDKSLPLCSILLYSKYYILLKTLLFWCKMGLRNFKGPSDLRKTLRWCLIDLKKLVFKLVWKEKYFFILNFSDLQVH